MTSATSRKLIVLCGIFLLGSCAAMAQDTKEKLDQLMEYFTANEHFNGSVLVSRKGTILLAKGYGYRDADKKIKNTENTIYQIGANTMQFTAELLLLIDAQGKLSMDDNVAKFIPDYPNGDKLTIKSLLTHTSGIYDFTADSAVMGHPEIGVTRDTLLGRFKNRPLLFQPDEKFEYSNANYVLAGAVAEKILDRTYEWLVKQRIYNPCGMSHSGFDFADITDENKAVGYEYPMQDPPKAAVLTDSSVSFAAAGMFSTVGDLYRWHKTLGDHKLLPKDWQEIGFTPYKNHYAFGWEVTTLFQKKFLEHPGSMPGFTSFEMRQENDDVFIVLLENTAQPVDDIRVMANNLAKCLYEKDYRIPSSKQLLAEKERIDAKSEVLESEPAESKHEAREKHVAEVKEEIAEKPAKHAKKTAAEKEEALKVYDGKYEIDSAFAIFVSHEDNDLFARASGEESYHILPIKNTLFYKAGVDSRIEFIKEEDGKVNKLILHQHGRDQQGIKNQQSVK